jgi:hypothetical protein
MKKVIPLLAFTILGSLYSCKGDKGDQGPIGPTGNTGAQGSTGAQGTAGIGSFVKLGFLSGTITGKRRDGVAFSEIFSNEYISSAEQIQYFESNPVSNRTTLHVGRLSVDGKSNLQLFFEVIDKGTPSEKLVIGNGIYAELDGISGYSTSCYISFAKELSISNIFILKAIGLSGDAIILSAMSDVNNTIYKFVLNDDAVVKPYYYYKNSSDVGLQILTTNGSIVQFEDWSTNNAGSYTYGAFKRVIDANGVVSTTSSIYGALRLSASPDGVIFRNDSGTDLSEIYNIKGDITTVSNYLHDASTGIISFDFTCLIAGRFRNNTTTNPLTITGKFHSGGKVYTTKTGRIGG